MEYTQTQLDLIIQYQVKHEPDSTCWRRTHAHCRDKSRRICKHHIKESYGSLFTLLHEIGHLETWKSSMTRAESEAYATNWAIGWLKENNLPIKRKQRKAYHEYILRCRDRAIRRHISAERLAKLNRSIGLR